MSRQYGGGGGGGGGGGARGPGRTSSTSTAACLQSSHCPPLLRFALVTRVPAPSPVLPPSSPPGAGQGSASCSIPVPASPPRAEDSQNTATRPEHEDVET